MPLTEFVDRILHRPAQPHTTLVLPDPGPPPTGGYFQLRLASMFLRDERRWFQEIVPATFVLADFDYGAQTLRKPFFVSNQMLSLLPADIDPRQLRVRFLNTLVAGPTPYAGGDVGLFIGLFSVAIRDWRRDLFAVLETLFGSVDFGLVSQYAKVADKLSDQVMRCLGGEEIECILAERRVIGQATIPAPGYLAYLRAPEGRVDTAGLVVQDDLLQRNSNGMLAPVEDLDYCVIRVEYLARRNDYSKMPFNTTLLTACEQQRNGNFAEAQALMLHCANQIDASPDLADDDKSALIELYQAKVLATRVLRAPPLPVTRSGTPAAVRDMQARAMKAGFGPDAARLAAPYDRIADLTDRLYAAEGDPGDIGEEEIVAHLSTPDASRPPPNELVRALAAGSLARNDDPI